MFKNLDKQSITFKKYTVTSCQTIEEVFPFLRLEKPKNDKNFQKTWKNASFIKKIAKICHTKKIESYSMADKTFSVTYYQTLKDVFRSLHLDRSE